MFACVRSWVRARAYVVLLLQIPYGDQVGVESHGMKLKDFMGYMRTLNPKSEELPLHVFDTNFLDSPVMAKMDYRPGAHGTGKGGDGACVRVWQVHRCTQPQGRAPPLRTHLRACALFVHRTRKRVPALCVHS